MDHFAGLSAKDQKNLLICWKENSKMFPILLSLGKDYLASSESSWASEPTFSPASNVCSSGHGSLKPQKFEICESYVNPVDSIDRMV
ncbi:hypothetical protein VP01_1725g2 [Puccinia sorghi]|uniref:HAT C-terminal dimerisation domain-containing protein n=1 Tax=Puccinia sorghi TaxID=27349 RepID=A0A0L6VH90_9BASI|nr:hypothetical protein VP01_1725g2 [Puccinia sorghi]